MMPGPGLDSHLCSPPMQSRADRSTGAHERNQPSDWPLGVGVASDQLRDVADRRRFGLDLCLPFAPRRPFGLKVVRSGAHTLTLPDRRLAELALLCDRQ